MEKNYLVESVQSSENGVILELVEVEVKIQPKIEALPKDETEKTISKIAKAVEKITGVSMKPTKFYPPGYEPHHIRIWLNMKEYQELGKPTVSDKLKIVLEGV